MSMAVLAETDLIVRGQATCRSVLWDQEHTAPNLSATGSGGPVLRVGFLGASRRRECLGQFPQGLRLGGQAASRLVHLVDGL